MPKRTDDYHGGGAGWRFSWRDDRLHTLHKLGQAFGLTEDSKQPANHEKHDESEQSKPDSSQE